MKSLTFRTDGGVTSTAQFCFEQPVLSLKELDNDQLVPMHPARHDHQQERKQWWHRTHTVTLPIIRDGLNGHYGTARGHYKARISTFFSWCVINKKRTNVMVNPCREIKLKAPQKRAAKMNVANFWTIHEKLSPIGQCFLELMMLTTSRPTEIRLLRESAIRDGVIHFCPTKTEDSSERFSV